MMLKKKVNVGIKDKDSVVNKDASAEIDKEELKSTQGQSKNLS